MKVFMTTFRQLLWRKKKLGTKTSAIKSVAWIPFLELIDHIASYVMKKEEMIYEFFIRSILETLKTIRKKLQRQKVERMLDIFIIFSFM